MLKSRRLRDLEISWSTAQGTLRLSTLARNMDVPNNSVTQPTELL